MPARIFEHDVGLYIDANGMPVLPFTSRLMDSHNQLLCTPPWPRRIGIKWNARPIHEIGQIGMEQA
jgi:hypothetical protein